MTEKLFVEDFIVLGRAVPSIMKKKYDRHSLCIAGISPTYGFMRIYPAKRSTPLKRWSTISVELERSNKDNRIESWKIKNCDSDWYELDEKVSIIRKSMSIRKKWELIFSRTINCVQELNHKRLSIGIIKPKIIKYEFKNNSRYIDQNRQTTFFNTKRLKTKKNFPILPYITYRCPKCQQKNPHKQHIIDWGVYQWLDKSPEGKNQLWENLQLKRNDREIYFLVGNQRDRRTSFLIISVLSLDIKYKPEKQKKKTKSLSDFY